MIEKNVVFFSKIPNIVVNSKKTKKTIARFENGKFETDDPILIEKLKPSFRHKLKAKNKRKGKTFEEIYGKKKARKMKLGMSRHHVNSKIDILEKAKKR